MMGTFLAREAGETIADQWQSQILARVLTRASVIMVTEAPRAMVEAMHMRYAENLEEALNMADEILGRPGTVTAIPDGIGVIVRERP